MRVDTEAADGFAALHSPVKVFCRSVHGNRCAGRQIFVNEETGGTDLKKGQIMEGIVEHVDFPNKGIVQTEEGKVIVKNAIPGQKVRFMINKKRKNKAEGRLLEVLEPSALECREPLCSIFPACGGCIYQTMDYEAQLAMKEQQVKKLLDDALTEAGQVKNGVPDYMFE